MAYDVKVRELRTVKAGELRASADNWRRHPLAQREALTAALEEIGFVTALTAREVDGHLELVDGHLRANIDPDQDVPVVIVDLDDEEARKAIATMDPIGAMAESDDATRRELLASTSGFHEDFERFLEAERRLVAEAAPPGEFPGVGSDLPTDHECPKCHYRWSGSSKPATTPASTG
jgi:ParB-like chromosome segregation protein Spo0J